MPKLKKSLGQHFLIDEEVIESIIDQIKRKIPSKNLLEVGPGQGALSNKIQKLDFAYKLIELDDHWCGYLVGHLNVPPDNIIHDDILQIDLDSIFDEEFSIIGNFPYNISSQIVFKIVDHYAKVHTVIGMFQKEVAQRICGSPGNKQYGVPSVLVQTYFDTEYLFDVPPTAFDPPPKVVSGVICLKRKEQIPAIDYSVLKMMVKTAFGTRRKKLRNSLKSVFKEHIDQVPFCDLRPEQLSWDEFRQLTELYIKIKQDAKR